MSTEDTYETQNDRRLDELHAKIRTIRGITNDIHDDVERQNLILDDTGNNFTSFGNTLAQTRRKASQAFGIGQGSLKSWRVAMYIVGGFFGLYFLSKVYWWWNPSVSTTP